MSRPRAIDFSIASFVFCFLTGIFLGLPAMHSLGLAVGVLAIALVLLLLFIAAVVRFGRNATWVALALVTLVTLYLTLTQSVAVYPLAAGQQIAWVLALTGEAAQRLKRTVTPLRAFQMVAAIAATALTLGWILSLIFIEK